MKTGTEYTSPSNSKPVSDPSVDARDTSNRLQLDSGEDHSRVRTKWWQIWIPRHPPQPPPDSFSDAPVIPVVQASLFSRLTYSWITPIMILGYQRTLQATDLWKMDETKEAGILSIQLDRAWSRRVKAAREWNARLDSGDLNPGHYTRIIWTIRSLASGSRYHESFANLEQHWRTVSGKKAPSLAWSLNDVFGHLFWIGGAFKVFGDTSQLMGPILVKALINFAKQRAAAKVEGVEPPPMRIGIGMALGLCFIVIATSLSQHQFWWHSMTTGVMARAALINCIYKRGVLLTGKSRARLSNADLVNHISTDVSRIDAAAQWFHPSWTAPIQVLICLIILIVQLGPSALAGFSLFLFIAPLQERVMAHRLRIRRDSMKYTDQRAKILLEILGAMRVVKYFSFEVPFLKRIYDIRWKELAGIRRMQHAQSANTAFAYSIPVLAATLAFVTYTSTTNDFDVAIVFSSFSLFQLLRQPMMFLPRSLSATADARHALGRLEKVFLAELMTEEPFIIDQEQKLALEVKDVTFEWETPPSLETHDAKIMPESPISESPPFQLRNINMSIPRGTLTAVVGRVASGKSSLLQGLIGEMRKVSGQVSFGGSVAYCPQTAWIQNTTLRENILFGKLFEGDKYWKVVERACLVPDLQLLPDGDLTEIGEKGINLSGGQKQRVNIARALYHSAADIVLFDDALSAVDANVGKSLFHNAIIPLIQEGKAVILVTHALHLLEYTDYVYTLDDGHIAEHGTFKQLIANNGEFARLDREFSGRELQLQSKQRLDIQLEDAAVQEVSNQTPRQNAAGSGKLEGRLMVQERRATGSVPWAVYSSYLRAGKGLITVPLILIVIVLMQGSQIANSYTLVLWPTNAFHRPFSFYQILYAGLGVSQAAFTLLLGFTMDFVSTLVSRNLHQSSVRNIFHAPMSFFDTIPTGRLMSVFGKDIDTIDNQLPVSLRLFVLTMANVVGALVLITILEHYFIIIAVVLFFGYSYFAQFYRSSARELKRLDAMLRSVLYAHFSESLTGLPTIRSYGEIQRFVGENKFYIDLENRALFLTVTNQRWLAVRLDALGAIMVFSVAIFAVIGISGINPAQIGLVLTYTTQLTQLCGMVTRQSAEVENYMNSVERVVHYSRGDRIEQEAPHEIPVNKPPSTWPANGSIVFKDVTMSYRSGLPQVLRGISMAVQGGERIGVVGRTGAGKSSLALSLLRIVEFSGSIVIDGIDISTIGLKDLRSKISIIPQDPTLFSGTVRSNIDPFSIYDDARLWDALKRSHLVEDCDFSPGSSVTEVEEPRSQSRIGLDTVIEPDGANLSVGERSLLSLARALIKNSNIIILDEATASVDLETDRKIQDTIQSQFVDRTLICIAHRLRTILSYDRILALEAGTVAEFDTPLRLFDRPEGIFRSLCDQSNISRLELVAAESYRKSESLVSS